MIIGGNKEQVIRNIQKAVEEKQFDRRVEVNDPDLSAGQKAEIIGNYVENCETVGYALCNIGARAILDTATKVLNRHTRIEGLEKISGIKTGAIVTSNHFNPLDNTVVRAAMCRAGYRRLFIVSNETNLAMKGLLGFLMNHADIIPITSGRTYMAKYFPHIIKKRLDQKQAVLIYPEQEMWFNYRKPRPLKRGAYFFAASNQVPVISCFVEIRALPDKETDAFYKTEYTMHILDPIYPDPAKTVHQNSVRMMQTDYRQKVAAYEKAYGKTLSYEFEQADIAGWTAQPAT